MKILFIGHDASRAGAQLLLLQLLQWIKSNHHEINFELLLGDKGDLLSSYAELSDIKIYNNYSRGNRLIRKIRKIILLQFYKNKKLDLIFCNSIVSGRMLNLIKRLNVPIVTHVHELDYWINKTGKHNIKIVKENSNNIIVASNAVRKCLVNNYNFDNSKIKTINEFVVYKDLMTERLSLKNRLNLSSESILIGASGAEIWRKGKDWFIPLALDVLNRDLKKEIHFVWIGGGLNYELKHDLLHSNKQNNIHFIDHLPFANRYFHEFTAFAMLSREDPFPVVNLEAAGLGVPIVCFDNAGGTPELVEDGCGFVVPYGDIHAFADNICLLIENEDLQKQISTNSIVVVKNKYDINVIGEKIIEYIHDSSL